MPNRKLKLEYVDPFNLKEAWKLIKTGVQKVTDLQSIFIAEDVYTEIKTGAAILHIAYVDNEYNGFVVTQNLQNHDGPVLHIWLAYSCKNTEGELLEVGLPIIKEWAQNISAKRVTFSSVRKGWAKNKLGFKPLNTLYGLEVK